MALPEAARYVGLHEQTLLARARAGKIPGAAKPGKRWVFLREGLRDYLISLSPYRGPLMKPSTLTSPTTKEGYDAMLGLPPRRKRRKQAWP
jgi:excisionase family DNA binding protein